ncbi:MAG: zinc-ribbon domain-containing protein [Promethearchaeota archaeon]
MNCPNCGSEILDNSNFCPDCGEVLKKEKIVIEETPLEKASTVRALEQKLDPTMEKRGEYGNFLIQQFSNIKAPKKKIRRKLSVSGSNEKFIVGLVLCIIGLILIGMGIAIMRSAIIEGLATFFVGAIIGFIGVLILEW